MLKYPELFAPEAPANRLEVLSKMRREDPVYYLDTDFFKAWLVTSYDDVSSLLHDKRLANSNTLLHLQSAPAREQAELAELRRYMQHALPETTAERHKILQTFFLDYFAPKRIVSIGSRIEDTVEGLLDGLDAGSEINFVEAFAYPLPAMVVADILGVPPEDFRQIISWSADLMSVFKTYDFEAYNKGQSALLAMNEYNRALMRSGSLRPDCLLAALARQIDAGNILEQEALVNCANILFAGHETTADALSKGMLEFFTHQDQLQTLCTDNTLLPNAVEEVVRKVGVIGWLMRLATVDFDYKRHRISKGDRILLSPMSANLDANYFDNAQAFDIKRENAKRHLGFGKGRHYCLGASLARTELEVSFGQIFRRFPNFRINTDGVVYGPAFFMNRHLSGNLPMVLNPG